MIYDKIIQKLAIVKELNLVVRIFGFARPSDWISEFAVRIFVKKSSDFNQKAPFFA